MGLGDSHGGSVWGSLCVLSEGGKQELGLYISVYRLFGVGYTPGVRGGHREWDGDEGLTRGIHG